MTGGEAGTVTLPTCMTGSVKREEDSVRIKELKKEETRAMLRRWERVGKGRKNKCLGFGKEC